MMNWEMVAGCVMYAPSNKRSFRSNGGPMNKTERLKYCIGCGDNFYNDNNSLDIKECWSLKDAKMVSKKEVHIDQVPPWTQKPIRLLSCFHRDGFWYVEPDRIN